MTLEGILMKVNHKNHPLILAAEQGAGKFSQNVNVVINPKVRKYSRNWLHQNYPALTLKNMKDMKTSVIMKEPQHDEQHSNSIKQF